MEIINFVGRKLNKPNEMWKDFRRQIEIDKYLKKHYNVNLKYEFYTRPKNILDFISKRYFLYPYYSHLNTKNLNKNVVFQIHFQFLADLALFLDKRKTIITCHDIFNFLQKGNIKNPIFTQKYALLGLRKCNFIVAISEFTKNELITKLHIPSEKIIVIKSGINLEMFKPIPKSKIYEIEPLYPNHKKLIYVGNEDERKNFITLLKAFYIIKKKLKKIKLIRVGEPRYSSFIKKLGLQKDILYLKNISNKRLREIHNLCDFYVFPSLYEGFGFPGLESAACGTPVICSDIPVLKEIFQDFPIYFPPKNYKELAKIVIENIENEDLKKELTIKGLKVVKNYSWKNSAEKYYRMIKYVLEN
ncbi:MAG: glycosyltransferase family 4 protein [Candidatus Hodarchaeota archaeon]